MSDPWEDAVKEPAQVRSAPPPLPPAPATVPQGPGPKPDAPPGKVVVLVNNKWFITTPPPAATAPPAAGGGGAISSKTLVNMAKLHSASAHEKGADGIRDAKSDAIATLLYEDAKLAKERAIRERMRKFNGR